MKSDTYILSQCPCPVESVFTLFGLHTRRALYDNCRGKLSFLLYQSNKILLQLTWTHFPVNHNKWPSKRPTLTRDAIQYETSPHSKHSVQLLCKVNQLWNKFNLAACSSTESNNAVIYSSLSHFSSIIMSM